MAKTMKQGICHTICVSFVLWMSAIGMYAQQVSEEAAEQKALEFLMQGSYADGRTKRKAPRTAPQLRLANEQDEYYVFNDDANGGYVIVSGDERLPDVLGYSYESTFDADNIPSNMQGLLDGYAKQIEYVREHPEVEVAQRKVVSGGSISPMLHCHWNQGAPYNNKCPQYQGARCVTGCVATAMAQIMYYHRWPEQMHKKIPDYVTSSLQMLVSDISPKDYKIDWANMLSSYSSGYTQVQADAVAMLMRMCGVAVEMDYTPRESGASLFMAGEAFSNYFSYDGNHECLWASDYTSDNWEQMLYDELVEGRPILYSGYGAGSGHAYVIDGYNNPNYFHVNFGWGGSSDGFFLLSNIPTFNQDQYAVLGLQPLKSNTPSAYAVYNKGVLTYYYDDQRDHREGLIFPYKKIPEYTKNATVKCVIDPSFKNYRIKSASRMFEGFKKLETITGLENLSIISVRDAGYMFSGCSSLINLDLSSFNTESVTNMECMFSGCSSLKDLDVSKFNTENVTNMRSMFAGCHSLTSLDVTHFNTRNVTNMGYMFSSCSSLTSLDVSNFNTENVTNMEGMFDDCSSLTSLDVTHFNTKKVTNMGWMFAYCHSLTNLDVSKFDTGKVTNMTSMFAGCSSLTNLDVTPFNTRNVTNMGFMFSSCSSLTSLDLSHFNTGNVTDMEYMFSYCHSLTSLDASSFYTEKCTNMDKMFAYCSALKTIEASDGWMLTNVKSGEDMFSGCYELVGGAGTKYDDTHVGLDYAHFDMLDDPGYLTNKLNANAIYTAYAVYDEKGTLTFYYDGEKKNREGRMLSYNGAVSTVKSSLTTCVFDPSFASFMMTNFRNFFAGCKKLKEIVGIENLNTTEATNMEGMFSECTSLKTLDVTHFNTENVENMRRMFYGCSALTALDVSKLNTVNVTDMTEMFTDCYSLKELKVGMLNTSNVTSMERMFYNCSYMEHLSLNGLNTTNVENMAGMFMRCTSLTDLDVRQFNTAKVTNMKEMFSYCSSLTEVNLNSFNTDKVTNMASMFENCTSLTSIDLTAFYALSVTNMDKMFAHCRALNTIYVYRDWTIENVKSNTNMFLGCNVLTGELGTRYNANNAGSDYACLDEKGSPGYLTYKDYVSDVSSIQSVYGRSFDIYDVQGVKVRTAEQGIENLPSGFYIIGNRKIYVK